MTEDALQLHRALETAWERLYEEFDEARIERRLGVLLFLCPTVPVPQANGPWVTDDVEGAAALADALAEVEAAGALPWVQTRPAHTRARQATRELGLTHEEAVPGMLLRPGELVEPKRTELEISLIGAHEVDAAHALLAEAFGAPKELFDYFCPRAARVDGARWYVGRTDGVIVSTAFGMTLAGATGVFNVATPPAHRGRGYGAALTARAARDGFADGAGFAYLQSSALGHGVYRRLGFRDVEEYTLQTRPPSA